MPGGPSEADVAAFLVQFYREHNPEKCAEVPSILRNWEGEEDELMAALKVKYRVGAESPAGEPAAAAPSEPGSPKAPDSRVTSLMEDILREALGDASDEILAPPTPGQPRSSPSSAATAPAPRPAARRESDPTGRPAADPQPPAAARAPARLVAASPPPAAAPPPQAAASPPPSAAPPPPSAAPPPPASAPPPAPAGPPPAIAAQAAVPPPVAGSAVAQAATSAPRPAVTPRPRPSTTPAAPPVPPAVSPRYSGSPPRRAPLLSPSRLVARARQPPPIATAPPSHTGAGTPWRQPMGSPLGHPSPARQGSPSPSQPISWRMEAQYERLRSELAAYQRRVSKWRVRGGPAAPPAVRIATGQPSPPRISPQRRSASPLQRHASPNVSPPGRLSPQLLRSVSPAYPPRVREERRVVQRPAPLPTDQLLQDRRSSAATQDGASTYSTDPPTPFVNMGNPAYKLTAPAGPKPPDPVDDTPPPSLPNDLASTCSFEDALGEAADVAVYRLCTQRLERQPLHRFGELWSGATYVVACGRSRGEHSVYIWRGREVQQDSVTAAARRAAEVALALSPPAVLLGLETQGAESLPLLSCFDGRVPVQLLMRDEPLGFGPGPRLLRCEGVRRRSVRLVEVACNASVLCSTDVALLVFSGTVTVWYGSAAHAWERAAATRAADALVSVRGLSHGEPRVVAEGMEPQSWIVQVGASSGRPPPVTPPEQPLQHRRIVRWDGRDFTHAGGLDWKVLTPSAVYVVDSGDRVWVWAGGDVPTDSAAMARLLRVGSDYIGGRAVPVAVVRDGGEPEEFTMTLR
eukprot:TRINITY_DN14395_c0_g1_i1.p1 TRINITY_DN14395_c0_g1~~TRINITY_DN14395_c0_g1_i1.p1  ORF type:complete len:821 (+),score=255.15 TRINITY_DN14395_c0_g1_i1:54-2465(+)